MKTSNNQQHKLFENYFHSIFSLSNKLSHKEYEQSENNYEVNYGAFLPRDKTSKILDIGCGAGHFLYFLSKKGYKNFHGIDISPEQISFCKKYITENVQMGDAFEFLKERKGLYDVIAANDFIEHIEKKKAIEFLVLVKESLKENGAFFVKTPNMGNPYAAYSRYFDFTHEIGFTEKSLYQALYMAGFENIHVQGTRIPLDYHPKRILERLVAKMTSFFVTKAMQYQGFDAPKILTSNLIAIAYKRGTE